MGSRLLNGSPQLSVRVTTSPLILIVLASTVTSGTIAGIVGVIIGVTVGIIVEIFTAEGIEGGVLGIIVEILVFAVEDIEGTIIGIIVEVLAVEVVEVPNIGNKYQIHNGDHVIYVHKANIPDAHLP